MKNKKPEIHTVATAHLDTSWLWTLEQTIEEYLPDTLDRNFEFIEQYPEYKFNFEGSYRYELVKEYYPEKFEKIRKYARAGRWNPCGACYENGDVNIPSPEALIRNILYGNTFFKKEFGVCSNDIFLPDCFGFGKALPAVAAHSGLSGFSTGKLFWGCSVDVPFDIGRWNSTDGNGIWAALKPFSYTTSFPEMTKAKRVLGKLDESRNAGLPEITFAYHGIGDRGGAPHKSSVKNVADAQRNNEQAEVEVYSSTTKEFFDKLDSMPDKIKEKMPAYDGEFLLTAYGAGSYTSRTVTKRWNRRCELLADAAERFASAAFATGLAEYPQYSLDAAWKNVLAHHFHDDITGTSFESCYKRNHNDYVQAMNTFSQEYTAACKALADRLDTSFVKGTPVIVSNPLQGTSARKEAVKVRIRSEADCFCVFDECGNEVPSQTKAFSDNEKEITFIAQVSSCGLAVYDLREAAAENGIDTQLEITQSSIENKNIKIMLDANGDICSVYDKCLEKELLSRPIRLAVMNNTHSFDWPAWEIKYDDLCEEPYMYAANPTVKIKDQGSALCSLEVTRRAGKSVFTQVISLDCESEFVSVYNETDWREEASLLKAEFAFAAANEFANYDIGIGFTQRGTNTKKLCEVPAQKWADITDEGGSFGVSVFSDSRTGWDKPDKNTLRLSLVHTPLANYRWECSQHIMDLGINRFSFAVMAHEGNPDNVTKYADAFCQPMHTFITEKHTGDYGKDFSFASLSDDRVRITAVKKAQEGERLILRVAECSGSDRKGVEASFGVPIVNAFEMRGDETQLCKAEIKDGKLCFDIGHNSIKTFALEFEKTPSQADSGKTINLDFNAVGITCDSNRNSSELKGSVSVPREIVPERFLSAGTEYAFSGGQKNCLVCDGSEIEIGREYQSVHLLLTSLDGDKAVSFNGVRVNVPDCFEELGHWDLMREKSTGYIKSVPQAITFTHTHAENSDLIAKQFYLFHAEVPLCDGKLKLPQDENIVIFAATAKEETSCFTAADSHFDRLEKREFDYEFSDYAVRLMNPNRLEKFLDRFVDRAHALNVKAGEFYNKYSFGELYFILRNICDKIRYEKIVRKLTDSRK